MRSFAVGVVSSPRQLGQLGGFEYGGSVALSERPWRLDVVADGGVCVATAREILDRDDFRCVQPTDDGGAPRSVWSLAADSRHLYALSKNELGTAPVWLHVFDWRDDDALPAEIGRLGLGELDGWPWEVAISPSPGGTCSRPAARPAWWRSTCRI